MFRDAKPLCFSFYISLPSPGTHSCIPEGMSWQKHKRSRINQLCPQSSLCSVGKPWSLLSCLQAPTARIISAYDLLVNLLIT